MDVYLVGGAVRDRLLGRPVVERDWVVVGSHPQEMIDAGFRQVGRDFPVFLHPQTGEEYALARTERKTGAGHTGFECYAAEDVTLEQDLMRRDLTVNAIAEDPDGNLVDPFGGRVDLANGVLRHVSKAFVEDPLRVFRVARFAAVLATFRIANETVELIRSMARAGALSELAAERVWTEWCKALQTEGRGRFLAVLNSAAALDPWFSGVDADAAIDLYAQLSFPSAETANAALGWVHDAGVIAELMARLKAPKRFERTARCVAEHKDVLCRWRAVGAAELLDTLVGIGALRNSNETETVFQTLEICAAIDLGAERVLIDELRAARPDTDATGAEYGAELRQIRLQIIERQANA